MKLPQMICTRTSSERRWRDGEPTAHVLRVDQADNVAGL